MALNIPLPRIGEGADAASEMLARMMQAKYQQAQIANQQAEQQRLQQLQPYNIKLKQAQAEREIARSKLPFGGEMPPGPAGQIAGLEMVKGLYGENSPQYQEAKSAYDLNQKSIHARVNYQDILSKSADKRFSTPLAKTIGELNDIRNGNMPGTSTPLSDDQKKKYEDLYGLDLLKKTTDVDTRKKNLFAHNIDITLGMIDPKALTQYSGIKGTAELLKDKAQSQTGEANEKYKKYEQSLTAAKTLAKQVRQFYGDSITPEIQKGLKELTDPASWIKSPEIALSNFNQFTKLLRQEAKTYQKAGESADIYLGNNQEKQETNENEISTEAKLLAKTIKLPDFNSKKEFQEWYNSQDKITKDAVKLKLRGK